MPAHDAWLARATASLSGPGRRVDDFGVPILTVNGSERDELCYAMHIGCELLDTVTRCRDGGVRTSHSHGDHASGSTLVWLSQM